jgi:hypothetical protein
MKGKKNLLRDTECSVPIDLPAIAAKDHFRPFGPFDSGRALGRDAVPPERGGVLGSEPRSDPLGSSPLMLVVMLRFRLREVPALSPLVPPLPRLFLVTPFELKPPRPLLRLATGATDGAPSPSDAYFSHPYHGPVRSEPAEN